MPVVLQNIVKFYGKNAAEFTALNQVSLKINDGEMVAIMGPSGSGKSTLLNIMGCIDNPSSGSYVLDGEDMSKLALDELTQVRGNKIGFIFQHFALLNDYTIYENVEMALLKKGLSKKERSSIIMNYLEKFDIKDHHRKRPQELSGGQQQRAAMIRALVSNPSYILADEPTGALDRKTSIVIMDIFKDIQKTGKTIIIVTHDMEVAKCCDRTIHIEDGKIINE